ARWPAFIFDVSIRSCGSSAGEPFVPFVPLWPFVPFVGLSVTTGSGVGVTSRRDGDVCSGSLVGILETLIRFLLCKIFHDGLPSTAATRTVRDTERRRSPSSAC